jgi:hypothetical protein
MGIFRVETGDQSHLLQLIQHPAEVPFTHPGHLPKLAGWSRPNHLFPSPSVPGVWAIAGYQGRQHGKLPIGQTINLPDPEEVIQYIV